jgi:hypothetical protein
MPAPKGSNDLIEHCYGKAGPTLYTFCTEVVSVLSKATCRRDMSSADGQFSWREHGTQKSGMLC